MPPLSRRTFLRATGVPLALPLLDAMAPRTCAAAAGDEAAPRRMIAVCINMGVILDNPITAAGPRRWAS